VWRLTVTSGEDRSVMPSTLGFRMIESRQDCSRLKDLITGLRFFAVNDFVYCLGRLKPIPP